MERGKYSRVLWLPDWMSFGACRDPSWTSSSHRYRSRQPLCEGLAQSLSCASRGQIRTGRQGLGWFLSFVFSTSVKPVFIAAGFLPLQPKWVWSALAPALSQLWTNSMMEIAHGPRSLAPNETASPVQLRFMLDKCKRMKGQKAWHATTACGGWVLRCCRLERCGDNTRAGTELSL